MSIAEYLKTSLVSRLHCESRHKHWNHYDTIDLIGQGKYGQVRLVRDRNSDRVFAMKVVPKKSSSSIQLLNEHRLLMSSPVDCNLLHGVETGQDSLNVYFVTEFCAGGDLTGVLGRFGKLGIDHVVYYTAHIAQALNQLHSRGFMHRDVKPDNVLLTATGHVKLCDFGSIKPITLDDIAKGDSNSDIENECFESGEVAELINDSVVEREEPSELDIAGHVEYMAVEMLQNGKYGYQCDWWSLGVVIYELLTGETPFSKGKKTVLIIKSILDWDESFEIPDTFPPSAKDLVYQLICDPGTRFDFNEVKNHPFFDTLGGWDAIMAMTPPFIPIVASEADTQHFSSFRASHIAEHVQGPVRDLRLVPKHEGRDLELLGLSIQPCNK